MLSLEILENLEAVGIAPNTITLLDRRADPMDKMVGAHLKGQATVTLYKAEDVVIKVGPIEKLEVYAKEHRILGYLREKDFEVPASRGTPRGVGNYAIALTTYIEHDPGHTPNPEDTASQLTRLHNLPAPSWLDVDRSLFHKSRELLSKQSIPTTIKDLILDKCMANEAAVAMQNQTATSVCHGDLHLGNILPSLDGPRLIDFEAAAKAHPLWDFSRLTHASQRFGMNKEWHKRCWQAWQEQIGFTAAELAPFVEWRSWYGVVDLLGRNSLNHAEQAELENRLEWAQHGSNNAWTRV